MKKGIAFLDFDGTITTRDTLLEFIRFVKGDAQFVLGFVLCSPFIVAMKLRIVSNQYAKEQVLRFFFGKWAVEDFNAQCRRFNEQVLPSLIRPKAMREIEKLKASGFRVVVVSASPENWVGMWAESQGLEHVATKLYSDKQQLSGRIDGLNCHGNEKVRRVTTAYNLEDFYPVYAYGDSKADKPLLAIANIRFFKPFR